MKNFKDYVKNRTGAATTEAEMEKLKKEYLKKTSGAAVTESALTRKSSASNLLNDISY